MKPKLKIIVAMTSFGTLPIFVRNIGLSSGEIAFFRAVIAAAVIALLKLISKNKIIFSNIKKDLLLLFLSGIAMGFNWIFLFQAYKYTTVSVATLSYYFAPVIVMAASPFLFKERLTIKQIVCFIMATIGLIMVIGVSGAGEHSSNYIGIICGIGAAVLYAAVILLNKFIKKITGIDRTLIQLLAAAIVLAPYVLVSTGISLGSLNSKGIINLLIIGIVHTGICYCLYFSSIRDLKGQEAAILSYIDPLVAVTVSVVILGETISVLQVTGGILLLGFTLLNETDFESARVFRLLKPTKTEKL